MIENVWVDFWGPNWGSTTAALLAMGTVLLFGVALLLVIVRIVDRWES